VDYQELYHRVKTRLVEPLGLADKDFTRVNPSTDELSEFARDPEGKVDSLIHEVNTLLTKIQSSREDVHIKNNKILTELQDKLAAENESYNKTKGKLIAQRDRVLGLRARLESIQALEPDELKNCFAVGVVKIEKHSDIQGRESPFRVWKRGESKVDRCIVLDL
jgi:hypothetical protein